MFFGGDEAGKGPALGPLVIGAVALDGTGIKKLKEVGVRDSKAYFSNRARESHAKLIEKVALATKVLVVPAATLNKLKTKYEISLNKMLEMFYQRVFKDLVNKAGVPEAIYIDAFEVPELLQRAIGIIVKTKIIAEREADTKYLPVMAASVLAKTTREKEIEKLRRGYGNFGSGYPSDPKTQKWLRDWYKEKKSWPPIVREFWETIKRIEAQ